MITPPPPRRYTEEFTVVWTPSRNAPSLLGDCYVGSTLTDCGVELRVKLRRKGRRERHQVQTYARATRDFRYYQGLE